MTHVVTEACIKCKFTDCVSVCPVDCFYEGNNMLVINPDQCIDCGICIPECPADAIVAEIDLDTDTQKWIEINKQYSSIWANIVHKKEPPENAEKWKDVTDKYNKYFKENINN
jgi:ferredoxin